MSGATDRFPLLRTVIASERSVSVKLIWIDMAGDLAAGVLLSQIAYWHGFSGADDHSRLTVNRDGERWLVKGYGDWHDETRLSEKQARRGMDQLRSRDLVVTENHKWAGAPTLHIRLNMETIERWLSEHGGGKWKCPTGQNQTPSRAEPGSAQQGGTIDRDYLESTNRDCLFDSPSEPKTKRKRPVTPIPDDFTVTDEMKAWARTKAPLMDVDTQTEQFCDHHRAVDSRYSDWNACWRTWMRNGQAWAIERQSKTNGNGRRKAPTVNGRPVEGEYAASDLDSTGEYAPYSDAY